MLTKKTCKLIGDLNSLHDRVYLLFQESGGSSEYESKLRLIRAITKHIEEQSRWFLKSKLPYRKTGEFLWVHALTMSYDELHSEVTKALLGLDSSGT